MDTLLARRRRSDAGAVTAETAVALPVLAVLAVALAWLVLLGVAQIRAQDAAREVARAVARGESVSVSSAAGQRVAGPGSTVSVSRSGGTVSVVVTVALRGTGRLLAGLGSVTVRAESVAAMEPVP